MEEEINLMTLCFIQEGNKVLLGRKTRKIGAGLWNGFGGNVEEKDKSIESAAIREVKEETGLIVDNLEYYGVIDFKFPEANRINRVYLFITDDFEGEPTVTEEISEFSWFGNNNLPFDEMLGADGHFIPEILGGRKVKGVFNYDLKFNLKDCKINDLNEVQEPELSEIHHREFKIR